MAQGSGAAAFVRYSDPTEMFSDNSGRKQLFNLASNEQEIENFSCAVKKRIMLHGRMYIYTDHVAFLSNLFGHKTVVVLAFNEIVSIRRAMTDLINKCIVISMASGAEHIFASFFFRDHTHDILKELWRIQLQFNPWAGAPPTAAVPPGASPVTSPTHAERNPAVRDADRHRQWHGSEPVLPATPHAHEQPAVDAASTPRSHAGSTPPSGRQEACTHGDCGVDGVTATPLAHTVLRAELDCGVDDVRRVLLGGSSTFMADFRHAQGTSDVAVRPWTAFSGGGRVRDLSFVQPVRNRLSPVKETRVQETQRCCDLPCGSLVLQAEHSMA
jgi:hypothetical protein